MDFDVIETVKKYTEAVKDFIPVRMVILYGSYARGTERQTSDIDVAVVVDKIKGDYLEQSRQLFHLIRGIDSRIEPVLLSSKDDKSGFLDSILKYGKIIYQT
jgi:predicted nucleotidyltransferase